MTTNLKILRDLLASTTLKVSRPSYDPPRGYFVEMRADEANALLDGLSQSLEEIEALRKELEFYGERKNYRFREFHTSVGSRMSCDVWHDYGARARAVLEQVKEKL